MKLYCGRHCEAEHVSNDPEKGLTVNGLQSADKMGLYLSELNIDVDHILHSTKARSKQTADIYAQHLQVTQVTECDLLLNESMSIAPLVDMLQTWHDNTLLVGHMPFVAKLVSCLTLGDELLGPIVQFPLGGMVCLDKLAHDRWIVEWMLDPTLIVS